MRWWLCTGTILSPGKRKWIRRRKPLWGGRWVEAYILIHCCSSSGAQPCSTLCDPVDCGPLGSSVHGISQARILRWVASSCSRRSFWPRDQTCACCVSCTASRFFTTGPLGKLYTLVLYCCSVTQSCLTHHGPQHARSPCPSPSPGVCWNSCPLNWWCHPTVRGVCNFLSSVLLQLKFEVADQCYSSVTAQFYLASKEKYILEAWGCANQKKEQRRERHNLSSSFYMFFSSPWACSM